MDTAELMVESGQNGTLADVGSGDWLGFCCRRINDLPDFGNPISRKPTLLRVLSHQRFIRGNVDTIDLVIGDVALDPLNLRAEILQNAT